MTTESGTHETRISRIEGILESVATKDFVRQVNAEMLKDINSKIDSKIDEQTSLFRSEMSEIHKEIKRLNEKQHRLTGAAELIRFALPIIISVIALLVALFRPI